MTKRQKEVLDWVRTYIERNGYSPSYRDIAKGLGLSSQSTVHKHIKNLESIGLLAADGHSRSIAVAAHGWAQIETAPRDGSLMLLYSKEYGINIGLWMEDMWGWGFPDGGNGDCGWQLAEI